MKRKCSKKANSANAVPNFVAVSKNFLLMQLIEGDLLPFWLETDKEVVVVKQVLREVLESCYRFERIGLDHGELSKAPKHVIVDQQLKPWIVDFETASENAKLQICLPFVTSCSTALAKQQEPLPRSLRKG